MTVTLSATPKKPLRQGELIALLAGSMALTALGIDIMLPAFGAIRVEYALAADSNATAGLVTTYFLGLAAGQLLYGVLADALGRKRALYTGYVIYLIGALLAILAPSLTMLYVARVLWGFGAASGRVVTLAVVRDVSSGDRMARTMSFIMAVFITVPIVAPALGSAILVIAPWRWTYGFCVVAVLALALWATRLPETLAVEDRLPLTFSRVVGAAKQVIGSRPTLFGAIGIAMLYGALTSWVASAELIIGDVFGMPERFPLVFGALAMMLGVGTLVNARFVERFGARAVTKLAMWAYLGSALLLVAVTLLADEVPPALPFFGLLSIVLGAHAVLVPNVNALAMEPMGKVAGTASSVIGAIQVAGGALLGSALDRAFDGTVRPLVIGIAGYSIVAAVMMRPTLRITTDQLVDA